MFLLLSFIYHSLQTHGHVDSNNNLVLVLFLFCVDLWFLLLSKKISNESCLALCSRFFSSPVYA